VWLVGPFDPAEHDRLAVLGLYSTTEIGDLAGRHVDTPAINQSQRTLLLEQPSGLAGVVDEVPTMDVRDAGDHAIEIAEPTAFTRVENRLEPGIDQPPAVERDRTNANHLFFSHNVWDSRAS